MKLSIYRLTGFQFQNDSTLSMTPVHLTRDKAGPFREVSLYLYVQYLQLTLYVSKFLKARLFSNFRLKAAAAVAQSVKHPGLRSLKRGATELT